VNHHLAEIGRNNAVVHPTKVPTKRATVPADTVVLVTFNNPVRELYDEIYRKHPDVKIIGDALAPRDLQYAIADGHRAVRPPAPLVGDRSAAP